MMLGPKISRIYTTEHEVNTMSQAAHNTQIDDGKRFCAACNMWKNVNKDGHCSSCTDRKTELTKG